MLVRPNLKRLVRAKPTALFIIQKRQNDCTRLLWVKKQQVNLAVMLKVLVNERTLTEENDEFKTRIRTLFNLRELLIKESSLNALTKRSCQFPGVLLDVGLVV